MDNNPTKSMIAALQAGNTSDALSSFQKSIGQKVNVALDSRKVAIASQIYPQQKKN
jgi:hypothetical protein